MVIRGRTRGNGRQLANYLLAKGENENIRILDVTGRADFGPAHVHEALFSMSLTSELSKSAKGLYHAQLNPAYGDDARMTTEQWLQAADMLGKELGYADQRRIVVLHTKKERTHAHVVWERFNLENNRMISDSFSRLAQDRARKEMERVFEQALTPHRNEKRPEMKNILSTLWDKAKDGSDFISECGKAGYMIAKGVQRRPFMVVDNTGRSFDLIRQLDTVKTKQVRDKLKAEKLPLEKEAITAIRSQQAAKKLDTAQEKAMDKIAGFQEKRKVTLEQMKSDLAHAFAATRNDAVKDHSQASTPAKHLRLTHDFTTNSAEITPSILAEKSEGNLNVPQKSVAEQFTGSRSDVLSEQTSKEQKRAEMLKQLAEQERLNQKNREKDLERD